MTSTGYPVSIPYLIDELYAMGNKCNYDCPVCRESGKLPNMAGRFFLINETECKCNACNTIFHKSIIYKPVVFAKRDDRGRETQR